MKLLYFVLSLLPACSHASVNPEAPVETPPPGVILFDGALDTRMGEQILTGLKAAVDAQAPDVTLVINSPGGRVDVMFAVFDSIRAAEHLGVRTKCVIPSDAMAASAAAVIFEACTERVMAPTAKLMFHRAWKTSTGNALDLQTEAGLLDDSDHMVAVWVAPRMHMTAAAYIAWVGAHQRWLDADEALEMHAADRVLR